MKRKQTTIASCILIFVFILLGCAEKEDDKKQPDTASVEADEIKKEADAGKLTVDAGNDDSGLPEDDMDIVTEEETITELEILMTAIKEKKRSYALREREILSREQILANLENSAARKIEELKKVRGEMALLMEKLKQKSDESRAKREMEFNKAEREHAKEREMRIGHLMATLKGMRSSAAAGLLASMDEKDAVDVLRQLSPRQAASIMGGMPAAKSAMLAQAMLGPRVVPPQNTNRPAPSGDEAGKGAPIEGASLDNTP